MLCGYRRTGKDSLNQILNAEFTDPTRFKWRVYRAPNSSIELQQNVRYEGKAFAFELKRESSEVYGIPAVVSDADKDVVQFQHYQTNKPVSARDIYIEWGALRRAQDPNYWCKKVCEKITGDIQTNDVCHIITDWRFGNEIQYVKSVFPSVIEIRIYRSEVPVPDSDIPSEHDLDHYPTQLLLLRDDDHTSEFAKALVLFPQYQHYVPTNVVL